ncbi:MAG: isoprenyl transferase [Alphaproteobacteria bacterium]
MEAAPIEQPNESPTPDHVAIIMDGNRRWAMARRLPRALGHRQGAEAVRRAVTAAIDLGIPYLTLYVFSSENWNRPEDEVHDLMGLLQLYLRNEIESLRRNGVRVRMIGNRDRLSPNILRLIEQAEATTAENSTLNLTVALSYGGRDDIACAARHVAEEVEAGRLRPEEIDEARLAGFLSTRDLPDPDLVIRTAGELRLSNFLLWQAAYAELVFLDKLWPDFDKEDLESAIHEFSRRERRYGARVG